MPLRNPLCAESLGVVATGIDEASVLLHRDRVGSEANAWLDLDPVFLLQARITGLTQSLSCLYSQLQRHLHAFRFKDTHYLAANVFKAYGVHSTLLPPRPATRIRNGGMAGNSSLMEPLYHAQPCVVTTSLAAFQWRVWYPPV
jgi:hypothetical protein